MIKFKDGDVVIVTGGGYNITLSGSIGVVDSKLYTDEFKYQLCPVKIRFIYINNQDPPISRNFSLEEKYLEKYQLTQFIKIMLGIDE